MYSKDIIATMRVQSLRRLTKQMANDHGEKHKPAMYIHSGVVLLCRKVYRCLFLNIITNIFTVVCIGYSV